MNTNTQTATINPIETLGNSMLKMISETSPKVSQISPTEWKFAEIDNGKTVSDYRLAMTDVQGKTGKVYKKRQLFRINADGTEKAVEFGKLKKCYLYKAFSMLKPKTPRAHLNNYDRELTAKLRDEVARNKANFSMDENGNINGTSTFGQIHIENGAIKSMKNNHHRNFGRKLYIDNKLVFEGAGLNMIYAAFNRKTRKK